MSGGGRTRVRAGKTGERTTSIAPGGFGEGVVRMGASPTFPTAASFTVEALPDGARVVVVEVAPAGAPASAPALSPAEPRARETDG